MKSELCDLGYSLADIRSMTPQTAWYLTRNEITKKRSNPTHHHHHNNNNNNNNNNNK